MSSPFGFRELANEKLKGEVTFLLNFTLLMPIVNSDQTLDSPESALQAIPLPKPLIPCRLFQSTRKKKG
jgi:hypothetical protein